MIRFAAKSLGARKLRSALTALAIVLGVAMVSGTYVLTDTIEKAFDQIFTESYAGTDVAVTGKAADIEFQGEAALGPPIPERYLADVRAVPGVEAATGSVQDQRNTKILTKDGKAVNTNGAPSFGFGIDPSQARFNPLRLVDGTWASSGDEVVIDVATADKQGYRVGDEVQVATLEPVRSFRVSGLAQFGELRSLGTATFAVFDIATAQELLHRQGKFDAISVAADDGVSPGQLARDIRAALPASVQVRTGQEQASKDAEQGEFVKFIRYFLLAFAAVALFVGAFVIFNTLSITVAQRTREFATLRTIGAARRQVLGSVVLEALVVGFLSAVVGLFAGLGLAKGLNAFFKTLDFELPTADTVFAPRTVIVSLLIGTGVTLVAGLFPAIRATRVPPIAAVREGATIPPGRFGHLAPYFAAVLVAAAIGLLAFAMLKDELGTAQRLLSIAGGVLALFIGVALLSSKLVRPLAAVVGWPATVVGGVAGRLAKGNSMRNPSRTAATAAALMIGVALVTFVAVLANGMKASNRGAIEDQVTADYVATAQDGFSPFVKGAEDALAADESDRLVTGVRAELGKVAGESGYVTGIDPTKIDDVYAFDWANGSANVLATLGRDGAIVAKDFADEHDLRIGSEVELLTSTNRRQDLVVRAIYEPPPFFPILGNVSISQEGFDALYDRPRNSFVFVNVDGDPGEATTRELERAVKPFPDAKILTREGWVDEQDRSFNQFLLMLYVLLALSVIVSLFGMVNTLVLSVYERTRELGLLRAVGMTKRQARRMVRHESVITALIGAALGVPLGILLAALVTRALAEFDVRFAIPYRLLVAFAVIAVVVGILAAIIPARRAARLNVLNALQYE